MAMARRSGHASLWRVTPGHDPEQGPWLLRLRRTPAYFFPCLAPRRGSNLRHRRGTLTVAGRRRVLDGSRPAEAHGRGLAWRDGLALPRPGHGHTAKVQPPPSRHPTSSRRLGGQTLG